MRLSIEYSFNCNVPSRVGMRFSIAETDEAPARTVRGGGETFNGITPVSRTVVASVAEALEVLDAHIGQTWVSWTLWAVEDEGGSVTYRVVPGGGRPYPRSPVRQTRLAWRDARGRRYARHRHV